MAVFSMLKSCLYRYPTLFNSISGGVLCAGSDALAQRFESSNNDNHLALSCFDRRRFLVAGLLGIFFGGFVYPQAYAILDARWHRTNFATILTKSCVEIATVGIFVNTCSLSCRGLLAGRDPKDVAHHVLDEIPRVTQTDVGVWLPYNLIAFSVIPSVIRPTTTAFMEASWQTYISLRSNDYKTKRRAIAGIKASTLQGGQTTSVRQ
jgi:Mpv17 / PMP22 family